MKKTLKAISAMLTITILMAVTAFLPTNLDAGNLEPTAPPGPTMHTLDEIYTKLETIETNLEQFVEPCEFCKEAPIAKTGQTTTYAAGDDGDLQKGVAWFNLRFTDHGDGTVTDTLTGLMWTKDANIYGKRNWTEALLDCASCTEGGHIDWRLPNVRELHSLIDYGQYNPALPLGHPFSNVQWDHYWSSTTVDIFASIAWYVSLISGAVAVNDKPGDCYVWCMRDGQ